MILNKNMDFTTEITALDTLSYKLLKQNIAFHSRLKY